MHIHGANQSFTPAVVGGAIGVDKISSMSSILCWWRFWKKR